MLFRSAQGSQAAAASVAWSRAELTHQAGNARDQADTEIGRAPARTRLNLGLGRPLAAPWLGRDVTLHLSAAVDNVTDSDVYDVEGFPLPGRTWRLAVAFRNP